MPSCDDVMLEAEVTLEFEVMLSDLVLESLTESIEVVRLTDNMELWDMDERRAPEKPGG